MKTAIWVLVIAALIGLLFYGYKQVWFDKLLKGKPAPLVKFCDCAKPGFDVTGKADVNCEEGRLFWEQECT